MPKEAISTPDPGEMFQAKVGWQRDRDVQVGVEVIEDRSMFWQLLGSDPIKHELGRVVRWMSAPGVGVSYEEWVARSPDGTYRDDDLARGGLLLNVMDVSTGWYRGVWASLDRRGCNEMIRALRRARDQAFGRDE